MKLYSSNANAMTVAKTRLLQAYPWYGVLIQRLNTVEVGEEFFEKNGFAGSVIGTDGVKVFYDKGKFESLKPNEQLHLVAQQVVRCTLSHYSRLGTKEKRRWNTAGVIVANGMLDEEKIGSRPQDEPFAQEMKGLSAEQVYMKLKEMPQEQQEQMAGSGMSCVMPPGADKEKGKPNEGEGDGDAESDWREAQQSAQETELNWKVAMEQAALQMKKRGLTSAGMDLSVKEMRKSKSDWRDRLRQLLTIKGDSTWARPNKRFIGRGMYLPSIKKSRLGHLVFAIDTSGSIGPEMLSLFAGEINEILNACDEWPEKVSVIWADCQVKGVEEQEGVLSLTPKGGGGTAFQPTFDYIKENDMEPQILFYLTDLCGDSPRDPKDYPVIWVVPEEYKGMYGQGVKWGELVVVEGVGG